jgi:hypothetical protein
MGAALGLAVVAGGCGGGGGAGGAGDAPGAAGSARSGAPSAVTAVRGPAVNALALSTGTDTQRIAATIGAFYRATWRNQGQAACSLFSPEGARGFLTAAHVAFPSSVNSSTTCAQAMRFFNADLVDSVNTLQQSGVNVSPTVLDHVAVAHVLVHGDAATAEAPEGVGVVIQPKLFRLVRSHGRWLIAGSQKLGRTLPQELAAARAAGKLK